MRKGLLLLLVGFGLSVWLGWQCRFDIVSFISQHRQRYLYKGSGIVVKWGRQDNFRFRCSLPANHAPNRPIPVAICFHGQGTDDNLFSVVGKDPNAVVMADSLLRAGYLVLTASARPYVSTWGNQLGLNAYVAAYTWAKSMHKLGPVVLVGNSMGGQEALLTIAQHEIPNIKAAVLNVPICNLRASYANPQFKANIERAYDLPDEAADFSRQTSGHDPLLLPQNLYSVPMLIIAATDDKDVSYVENTKRFLAHINDSTRLQVRTQQGGHGASIVPYMSLIMSFLCQHSV